MARTPETPEGARPFTWFRAGLIGLAAVAIIVVGSWIVRAFPNPGYQAGYDATIAKGQEWIRAEVEAAGGTAGQLCEDVHREAESAPLEPRYDHDTFVKGCADAVKHLHGG